MEIFQDGELEEEMRKRDFQAHNLSAIWHLFSTSYQEAITSLTNPVRATYALADLGPARFTLPLAQQQQQQQQEGEDEEDEEEEEQEEVKAAAKRARRVQRDDLQLLNPRGEALECSLWRTVNAASASSVSPPPPCIVYLHGMSSSRKECVYLRDKVLARGFSLFTLDLSGSGVSEGDRMSFGHFEKDDLRTVVEYLFSTNTASRVGLWGRCIGGATALLYLCDSLEFEYKKLRLPRRDALKLQLGQCRHTGQLLCVRPGRVFGFRVSQLSVSNGDFVVLSVGGRMVKGLDVESCRSLITETSKGSDVVEICGYVRRGATAATAVAACPELATSGGAGGEPFVFALALDSTYGDMEQVISDMLVEVSKSAEKRNVAFPSAMVAAASKIISRSVRKSAGFQLRDIAVVDAVSVLADVPCQFVSAAKVDFIRPEHTRALFDNYGGAKHWLAFDGVHDQNRPDHVVDAVCSHFAARWCESRA